MSGPSRDLVILRKVPAFHKFYEMRAALLDAMNKFGYDFLLTVKSYRYCLSNGIITVTG